MDPSKDLFKKVLTTQYFAVLSTLDGTLPYLNLVSFAMADDMKILIFVTKRKTRKYRNIMGNNTISILIDNRNNQPSDISDAVAITILGTVIDDPDHDNRLKNLFLSRHPHLRSFIEDPEIAIMVVTVGEYILATFNNVQRFVTL